MQTFDVCNITWNRIHIFIIASQEGPVHRVHREVRIRQDLEPPTRAVVSGDDGGGGGVENVDQEVDPVAADRRQSQRHLRASRGFRQQPHRHERKRHQVSFEKIILEQQSELIKPVLPQGGPHSTEVAFALLTQRPRV